MDKIKAMMELVLKNFTDSNFKAFIKNLLTLRTEVIKTNPEGLELGLVDLVMDDDMWSDWVISAIDRDPTEYDWKAANYIALDLQDILSKM